MSASPVPSALDVHTQAFPILTPAQIARVKGSGKLRRVEPGEVLFAPGDTSKTVSVSGITIASATNGSATVYGYTLSSSSASAVMRAAWKFDNLIPVIFPALGEAGVTALKARLRRGLFAKNSVARRTMFSASKPGHLKAGDCRAAVNAVWRRRRTLSLTAE